MILKRFFILAAQFESIIVVQSGEAHIDFHWLGCAHSTLEIEHFTQFSI